MARDASVILSELVRLAPWWLRPLTARSVDSAAGALAAGAVGKTLTGLAAVLALVEVARDDWRSQARRASVTGAYLDSYGEERGLERWPGESEAAFKARLVERAQGATVEAMRAALAQYAAHIGWPGAVPIVNEPCLRFLDLIGAADGFFADDPLSLATADDPQRLVWLHLPEIGALVSDPGAYGFLDSAYADSDYAAEDWRAPLERWIYRDLLTIAEGYRPAGVALGATIEDADLMAGEVLAMLMQGGGGPVL